MNPDHTKPGHESPPLDPTKVKFDEYYGTLIEAFQSAVDNAQSPTAILIIKDGNNIGVYPNGHFYDVAVLLNNILQEYKTTIGRQLS